MKTKGIVAIVIAVVVIGGGYWYMTHKSSSQNGADENIQQTSGDTANTSGSPSTSGSVPTAAKPGAFTGTLSQLIARGGDFKCTIDTSTAGTRSSGIMYLSGKKMRGDFTTTISGFGDVMSYMISDGTTMYVWSTAAPMGFKTAVKQGQLSLPGENGQMSDATKSYTYTCESWSVNQTLFVPPSNISFTSK